MAKEKEPKGKFELSEDEKARIQLEVEDQLEKEAKSKAEKDYKDSLLATAKKKALFKDAENSTGDGLIPVFINLPPVADVIRLDGVTFYPGRTYNVTRNVAATLFDIMDKANRHEREIKGIGVENAYRKKGRGRI